MKSFRINDEAAVSEEIVRKAILDASRRKRNRQDVARILDNIEKNIELIQGMIVDETYRPRQHNTHIINDSGPHKQRQIVKPDYYPEQIVHHVVVEALKPGISYGMSTFVLGSIPGRGAHKGKKYIEKWFREDEQHTRIIGKMDIRHFFQSVDHEILRAWLHKKIRKSVILDVCDIIIDALEEGLPLGFYTSQWFSNFLLQPLDHYIMEQLHVSHMTRYMDDIVIMGSNKRVIHQAVEAIDLYLWHEYHLTMKKNWQVFRMEYKTEEIAITCPTMQELLDLDFRMVPRHKCKLYKKKRRIFIRPADLPKVQQLVDQHHGQIEKVRMLHGRPLDYMGLEFHRDRTILRKSVMLSATRKAAAISKADRINWVQACGMLSYIGWIDHSNTYAMYEYRIKPYISVRALKRIISTHQRRLNNETELHHHAGLPGRTARSSRCDIERGQGLPEEEHPADHPDRQLRQQGDALAVRRGDPVTRGVRDVSGGDRGAVDRARHAEHRSRDSGQHRGPAGRSGGA